MVRLEGSEPAHLAGGGDSLPVSCFPGLRGELQIPSTGEVPEGRRRGRLIRTTVQIVFMLLLMNKIIYCSLLLINSYQYRITNQLLLYARHTHNLS